MNDSIMKSDQHAFLTSFIDPKEFSVRSYHCLKNNNVNTIRQLLKLTRADLEKMWGLGEKSVNEIVKKINEYKDFASSLPINKNIQIQFERWLNFPESISMLEEYFKSEKTNIDVLDKLSPRAYNLLSLYDYNYLFQLVGKNASDYVKLPGIDSNTASEIEVIFKNYLIEHAQDLEDALSLTFENHITDFDLKDYKEKAVEYIRLNDLNLEEQRLSPRAHNVLKNSGYHQLSEIAFLDENELKHLPNAGVKSAHEIYLMTSAYIRKNYDRIKAYCLGDYNALFDDSKIHDLILSLFNEKMNKGMDYDEIMNLLSLPEGIESERAKHILGKMLSGLELEYTDGFFYRVYGKFENYYKQCPDISARDKSIISDRLNGKTLENIGTELNLTRERVRQISSNAVKKVTFWYTDSTGMNWFDEDYFKYIYEKYDIPKTDAEKWLGISSNNYHYLQMVLSKKGTADLNEALTDNNIEISLRLKIRTYLNRNKIRIANEWVPKRRTNIVEFVIRTRCTQDTKIDDFIEIYNSFCEEEKLPEKLFMAPQFSRTIGNHLADSRYVLWKQSRTFRYYDIDSRDYTDLIDELDLENYNDIEVSTIKFMEDYPELMKRYDIRDQYELHNLLKKIIPQGSFHHISFGRMPNIKFGVFNRNEVIMQMIRDNSPISLADLCHLIHKEFGYEEKNIPAVQLAPFSLYYYQGIYSVPDIEMPEERLSALKDKLTKDFYYTEEIRNIYLKLFKDGSANDINAYNLKKMGFKIYSSYAIQHFDSAYEYFKYLLTKEPVYSIKPYRRRYTYIQGFYLLVTELKNDLILFEYKQDEIVQFSQIAKAGFSKQDILNFRDQVFNAVSDGQIFTIHSLRKSGFESHLDALGFDDWFYGDILTSDDRFHYSKMMQNLVFFKGSEDVTLKSFLFSIVNNSGESGIDRFDLLDILTNTYGCADPGKDKLNMVLKNSGVFYDEILDRFYRSEDAYFNDLETGDDNDK